MAREEQKTMLSRNRLCEQHQQTLSAVATHWKKYIIILTLLLTQQSNAQTTIRFQPNITPNVHYLGDVLLITHDKNNLAKLPLDSTPITGQQITKKQIMSWIKNKKGHFSYQWRGKKNAVVKQRIKTSGIDLLSKAQTELKNQLQAQDYSRIELISKTKLKGSAVPLSAFKAKISGQYPSAKRVCVRLNYNKRSIPIWFTVKAYKKVLVAKHKIKHHTALHADDFIIKERNIAGLKALPYSQLPSAMWLQKTINADQILTAKQLIATPAVTKGQKIQIKVVNRGISLTTEAIAQHDGYIGQTVRMKNVQTNKFFRAVVTSSNQAEISS